MTEGRPLHSVFTELLRDDITRQAYAADPGGLLSSVGHGELPDDLLAEAIVSFADTAAPQVAEHLAPFVMAHSAVPLDDAEPPAATAGLDLLADAPGDAADTLGAGDPDALLDGTQIQADTVDAGAGSALDDLDFGGGAGDTQQAVGELPDLPIEPQSPVEAPLTDTFDEIGRIEEFPPADVAPELDELDAGDDDLPE